MFLVLNFFHFDSWLLVLEMITQMNTFLDMILLKIQKNLMRNVEFGYCHTRIFDYFVEISNKHVTS